MYLYLRAETEVEGAGKLSGQDKALLSAVWIPALVYALMSKQVMMIKVLINSDENDNDDDIGN